MTDAERNLLLTIGRILRARIREEVFDPSGNNRSDFQDMQAALAPFDSLPIRGGDFKREG